MAECPMCGAGLTIPDGARTSEIVACVECATELEILSLDPAELALAPEVEEDWGE